MKPDLLVLIELGPDRLASLANAGLHVHSAPAFADRAAAVSRLGPKARAVLTNGVTGFSAAEIAELPNLEIICALGAGYENVDVEAAQKRGIIVTHSPGANAGCVADHAIGLLLAATRAIPQADAAVRRGEWASARHQRPSIFGKRLGVLGLGAIGKEIARRAAGGFDMEVAYHNRREIADSPFLYHPTPESLAAWADFLVAATPGGLGTKHLVNAEALDALGPSGYIVNIARGSVIDTFALIDALKQKRIAGAALDVVEGEPTVPLELASLSNVVLTPHIGGLSPESLQATLQLVIDNLTAHFSDRPVLTPAPLLR